MKKPAFALLALLAFLGPAFAQGAPESPAGGPSRGEREAPAPEGEPQPPGGQLAGEEHLDIIFAVDASGSVTWTDPDSFRKAVANCFIDITQDRGGDRVAVVLFAGWAETSRIGATVWPHKGAPEALSEIPNDPTNRRALLTGIKNAINEKLGAFGTATDFNFAFGEAISNIKNILDSGRKSENKTWVILISDGSMEVVEGKDVRPAYRARLDMQKKRINRANLNEAAREIFTEEILPRIARNENVYITCINLGSGEPSDILLKISELSNGQLLRTSDENLISVVVGAFSGLPEGFPDHGIPRGFGYLKSTITPAATVSAPFHIYQGSPVTRLLLLASTRDFSIDVIRNKDGASLLGKPNLNIFGKGESYRLVSITNEFFGDYHLDITSTSDVPATFELLEYAELDLAPFVSTVGLKAEFYPGETLEFEVGLREAKTSTDITDPILVSQAEVLVQVEDVDGNISKSIVPFQPGGAAKTTIKYELPEDAPGGEYKLLIWVGAIKDTVSDRYAYAFLSKPVSIAFSVLSPVVELHFAQDAVLIGQAANVEGTVVTGSLTEKQKQEGIIAKVVHTALQSEKEVALVWDEQSGKLSGAVTLDETKEWKLERAPLGTGEIRPAKPEQITVKPREMRIMHLDEKGNKVPVKALALAGKLDEIVKADFFVEADLVPGETGELGLTHDEVMEEAVVSVTLSGGTGAATTITGENPSAAYTLTLKLDRYPQGSDVGEIVVSVKLPGASLEKRIPVSIEVPARPFPWLYVAIAAAALLLLIIIIALLAGGPTFERQQLHIFGGAGHLLKEWKTGKKNAVGTVEVPRTLLFRLKGKKARPRCILSPGKNARVFVNNVECTNWAEIHHGDYIELYPAGDEYSYRYRYFDRAPTAAELQALMEMPEEVAEGVFLGEDEFILADDELEAASGDATQALLEQARRMKERMESEATEVLMPDAPPGETEIVKEAARTPADEEFITELVPPMPQEPTGAIVSEPFEEIEATEVLGEEEGAFFEESEAPAPAGDDSELPVSDDLLESEPTQVIGEEAVFEEIVGEPTEAIVPEPGAEEEALVSEPTEEMEVQAPTDVLTELGEDHIEMTEFIEEKAPQEKPAEEEEDLSLADELDKTFDEILREEEEKKDEPES